MTKLIRLPLVPESAPVQLVLGLEGVGIRKSRKRRRGNRWVPSPLKVAA